LACWMPRCKHSGETHGKDSPEKSAIRTPHRVRVSWSATRFSAAGVPTVAAHATIFATWRRCVRALWSVTRISAALALLAAHVTNFATGTRPRLRRLLHRRQHPRLHRRLRRRLHRRLLPLWCLAVHCSGQVIDRITGKWSDFCFVQAACRFFGRASVTPAGP